MQDANGRKVTAQVETISPSKAIELLANWAENPRPLNQSLLGRLKSDMKSGAFTVTGEAIILGPDDLGLDGRHRLTACVQTGVAIQSLVVRGVPETALSNIDGGMSRNVGQRLVLAGVDPGAAGARNFAAAIAWTWRLSKRLVSVGAGQRGVGKGRNAPTFHESIETVEHYPAVAVGAALAGHATGRSIFAALYAMVAAEKGTVFALFVKSFLSGAELATGSPILLLRSRLITSRKPDGQHRNESTPPALQAALIIKTWNAHVLGAKNMKILRAKAGARGTGAGGEPFPEIMFARYWANGQP
jgi:hypothetical protein